MVATAMPATPLHPIRSRRKRNERTARASGETEMIHPVLVAVVVVLLAAALPAGGGLARLAIGVVATTLTIALVAVVARPMSTRAPRG